MNLRKLFLFVLLFIAVSFNSWGQVVANFTASPSSGCATLIVHFTNTSTGATSYSWNFNNGTPPDTLTNPSASFLTAGTYTVVLTAHNGTATSTHSLTINVYAPPVVSFTANDTAVCLGSPISFTIPTNSNGPPPSTYSWNFGDGNSSTSANPTHTYQQAGYYSVSLTVTNSYGCTSSLTLNSYIHVLSPPVAGFTVSPPVVCHPPGQVTFTNTSQGSGPFTYQWNFGDGSPTTGLTNPTHTYNTSGIFNVRLITTDVHGCKDTSLVLAAVNVGGLAASFSAPDTVCIYSNVTFTNTTSQNYISSFWTFGGNSSSFATSPTYQFDSAGTYLVTLVVYDGFCYDTVVHNITIMQEPASTFTFTPLHPCPQPATVQFNSSSPAVSSYNWTFGDQSPGSFSANPVHTFVTDNFFNVTMIATNSSGCSDTLSEVVKIYNLILNMITLPYDGCIPLTIHFSEKPLSNTPSLPPPSPLPYPYPYPIVSWSWNFGDGSPLSTQDTPSHTYNTVGVFHVHLTFTTANGCTYTDSATVEAGTTPTLDSVRANPTHICNHDTVNFHAYGHGIAPLIYTLNSGAPNTSPWNDTSGVFHYIYGTPGVWHPSIVMANYGCPDTNTLPVITITIDSPEAVFLYTISCDTPLKVVFHNYSIGADSARWDFGDGTYSYSDSPNVTHFYNNYGTYIAVLVATNKNSGCKDTSSQPLTLYKLQVLFATNDTAVCKGATVVFTSNVIATPFPPFLNYFWYINNVFIDTPANLSYTFNSVGYDTVSLVVIDPNNCGNSITKPHYIIVAKPVDSFYASPLLGCSALLVHFYDSSTDIAGANIVSHAWTFGDGSFYTSVGPDTTHIYFNAGSYNVKEVVTDNIGCKDSLAFTGYVNVHHPVPGFMASNLFPCIGSSVTFTDTSTGNILTRHWDFGDGDTSDLSLPLHAYIDTGVYTIKLVVKDQLGCSDSLNKVAYIHVTKPIASFTPSDTAGACIPLNVVFTNTSTGFGTAFWNFGNGNTSMAMNPSNSYSVPGLYQVTLIVTDAHGCIDTATRHVSLYGYSGSFTYSPLEGCRPLTVNFTANVTNIQNIFWDFSDGTIVGPTPILTATHTFTTPGAYLPKIILKDSSGCTASSVGIDTIKVDDLIAGYKTTPNQICIYDTVHFTDTSHSLFSKLESWKWIFNNTNTSNLANPIFYYPGAGIFAVEQIVTDSLGCVDTSMSSVRVDTLPVIKTGNDTIICLGDAAHLNASGAVSYSWTPAATLTCGNCQSPLASPAVATEYFVTGTDVNGCKNIDSTLVSVNTKTTSTWGNDTFMCAGGKVPLLDTGAQSYIWYPAAGLSNNTIPNPIASPQITTKYMIIATSGSCTPDTGYITVTVHPKPMVSAGSDVTIVESATTILQATGTNVKKYVWSPDYGLSCDTCANPTVKIPQSTTYTVTGYSGYGCTDTSSVTVHIICEMSQVFIPNSFTPNGDGQNDVFYPRGVGIKKIKALRIYDRWGEIIFERDNIDVNDEQNGWDGTYKGSKPRPDVYIYTIDAICETGEELNWKGDVSLIK